jgi:hypothetical protein
VLSNKPAAAIEQQIWTAAGECVGAGYKPQLSFTDQGRDIMVAVADVAASIGDDTLGTLTGDAWDATSGTLTIRVAGKRVEQVGVPAQRCDATDAASAPPGRAQAAHRQVPDQQAAGWCFPAARRRAHTQCRVARDRRSHSLPLARAARRA